MLILNVWIFMHIIFIQNPFPFFFIICKLFSFRILVHFTLYLSLSLSLSLSLWIRLGFPLSFPNHASCSHYALCFTNIICCPACYICLTHKIIWKTWRTKQETSNKYMCSCILKNYSNYKNNNYEKKFRVKTVKWDWSSTGCVFSSVCLCLYVL